MERIASFTIDHLNLESGLYVSRKDMRENVTVTTFDMRVTAPNKEPVMDMPALHTIEHLGATFLRNSEIKDDVVYFGPMGCRTGFYFLLKDTDHKTAVKVIKDAFRFIADFNGEIPGTTAIECGNYLEHDLGGAKKIATEYLQILENVTEKTLNY